MGGDGRSRGEGVRRCVPFGAALLLIAIVACRAGAVPDAQRSVDQPDQAAASAPGSAETVAAREALAAARTELQRAERIVSDLGERPSNGGATLSEWDRAMRGALPALQAAQRALKEAERRVEKAEQGDRIEGARASGEPLVLPEACEETVRNYQERHPPGDAMWMDAFTVRFAMRNRLDAGDSWAALEADCRSGLELDKILRRGR